MSRGRLTPHITEKTAWKGSSTLVFHFRHICVCFLSETSATKTLVHLLVHTLVATKLLLVPPRETGLLVTLLLGASQGSSGVGSA